MRISAMRHASAISPDSSAGTLWDPLAALLAIIATLLASGYLFLAGLFYDRSGSTTMDSGGP